MQRAEGATNPTSPFDPNASTPRRPSVLVRGPSAEWGIGATIRTEPGTLFAHPRPRHNGSRMVILRRLLSKARSKGEIRRRQAWKQAAAERDRDRRHGGSIWRSGKGGSHIG